jgi:hypothetical protein
MTVIEMFWKILTLGIFCSRGKNKKIGQIMMTTVSPKNFLIAIFFDCLKSYAIIELCQGTI